MKLDDFRIKSYIKRLLFVLIFTIIVVMFMDLNSRLVKLYQKNEQREELEVEIYQLELTATTLHTQIAYATSEAAVEEYAREHGKLTLPGDVPVIPVGQPDVNITPAVTPTPLPKTVENWEVWQALFFGK